MKSEITLAKRLTQAWMAWLAVALVLFAAAPAHAHGGFDHVRGTVVKVANHVLTVKTSSGNMDVMLNDKTELFNNDRKAAMADLAPGVRVVVDIREGGQGGKVKLAHSVKIGVGGKIVTQVAKGSHK